MDRSINRLMLDSNAESGFWCLVGLGRSDVTTFKQVRKTQLTIFLILFLLSPILHVLRDIFAPFSSVREEPRSYLVSLIWIDINRASEPPFTATSQQQRARGPMWGVPDAPMSKSGSIDLFDTWANVSHLSGALSSITKPKPSARCHSRYRNEYSVS